MKKIASIIKSISKITNKEEGNNRIENLQSKIQYKFKDITLLETALMHRSYVNDLKANSKRLESNERLEFLGDAVLEILVSEHLYKEYKDLPEGQLTKLRSNGVCETTLARLAKKINLGSFIYLAKGENLGGGRNKPSILSDAFEALVGAIYLDGGYASAKKFVQEYMIDKVDFKSSINDDKTRLQEILQRKGTGKIEYKIIKEKGPAHDREFVSEVIYDGKIIGMGAGKSKKEAEQNAAHEALESIEVLKG